MPLLLALSRGTRDEREAMAIGRHQAHRLGLLDEQRAVQEIARVFAGDRKLRFRNHVLQHVAREASRCRAPVPSGSVGKSSRGSVCIRESKRSAATLTPLLSSSIRTSVSGSALMISYSFFAGSVSEPLFATDACAPAAQPDLEIRRQQPHLIAVGLDQHVRQDGDRVLAFDDALEQLQFAQQIGLAYDQFHVGDDLAGRRRPFRRRRADPFNE